ncbi:AAWKG family protein [Streptomyces sp. 21So2-11]|uniref:AAWKG family protein n=1 Tax=Streptomyces sp. 21So2-11 TaxID=3144408 RepID=UPI00321BA68A
MAADTSWESVVKNLTGFDGGTRVNVAAVGGADAKVGDGSEWMSIKITSANTSAKTPSQDSPGAKLGRTMKFYGFTQGGSESIPIYTVELTLPMSSSNGADWSDGGNAGIYDWGHGAVLGQLKTLHNTIGFGAGYRDNKGVKEADAVDLRTFPATALAFDRVTQYFSKQSPVLEKWVKDLDGEYSAYRGTGADVFRDLIDALGIGYKDLLQTLSSTTPGSTSISNPSYKSNSIVSDKILQAEQAIHKAAVSLRTAWDAWISTNMWLGTVHLDKLLDEVAVWLNENNISRVQVTQKVGTTAGFKSVHEKYGDLTQEASWKEISKAAYLSWAQTLVPLDAAAESAKQELHQALARLSTNADFTFKPGTKSLTEANAADQAGKAKTDADEQLKKEKDDAKKEVDQQKEDMQKEKDDAKKEMENLKNGGGDGGGIKPPPLDPNKTGGNEFGGIGGGKDGGGGLGDNSEKPPTTGKIPPLGLNDTGGNSGAGLGDSIKNPDGSVTSKNPDGSMVTTFPDGHKEVTPPGILPPSLNPNGTGGGWGTGAGGGGGAGKTVKGPDGSTTTYNPDGSRTTTHKDGTATTINPDGSSVTNNPDGSKTVLNKDGSETITYQDGTKTTVKPDGTTITQYPDGTSTKLAPNGTLTTTDAQGNNTTSHPAAGSTVKNPDGSSTVYGKDGATTTTHADGTKTTVAANGTITTVDPDGTKTVSHLGKGTSSITYADGSVAQVGPDGTVSTTYKDGSTTKLGPDGTYTTTDADGQKKTEHLNTTGGAGPQTTHNPDGSSSTTYPDGTVDKKLKDGGHQISYPDGRTVTTDAYGRTTGTTGGGGGNGLGLGLGPNKTGGGLGNYDYYDYPDGKSGKSPLNGGGYGGGTGGDGAGGGRIPPLGMNPLGGQGLTPGGGMGGAAGTGAGMGGERNRSMAVGEAANARSSRAAQLAAEEAAMARRPSTSSSGGPPMMPPMGGGMGGGAGGNTQSDERERSTWVSEDEGTWGTDEGGVSAAIGR